MGLLTFLFNLYICVLLSFRHYAKEQLLTVHGFGIIIMLVNNAGLLLPVADSNELQM